MPSAAARAQAYIRPCECLPCGGQIECQPGSTSWCECRDGKCFGGCLRNDPNPRRYAAAVLTVVAGERGEITAEGLQKDPKKYADILGSLLANKQGEQTYRIEYEHRKIGFVFTEHAVEQLSLVVKELQMGGPSATPTQTPTRTPTPEEKGDKRQTSVAEAIKSNGWVGLLLNGFLLAMSLYSLVVASQFLLTFSAAGQQSREFAPRVAKALKDDRIEDAIGLSHKFRKSHLAIVVNAALQEFLKREASADTPGDEVEASRRAVENAIAIASAELSQGLSGLATVSRVAPWIGLFGLTYGLIFSLQSLTSSESLYDALSRPRLIGGLYMMALGIFVSVGTRLAHSHLSGKVHSFVIEMENVGGEISEYLLKHRTRQLAT